MSFPYQPKVKWVAAIAVAALCGTPAIIQAETSIKLGLNGVGQISASAFDLNTLRATHPEFLWSQTMRQSETGGQTVMTASLGGPTSMTVMGDGYGRISQIEVVDAQIGNWMGPRIGDPYKALHHNLQLGACEPGMEHRSGTVLCRAAETTRVTYVFSGRWNGPDGQLPPKSALDQWTMSEMIWNAETSAQPPVQTASSPSFDCADTFGSVEEMICADPALMALDRRLNDLYAMKIDNIDADEALTVRAFQRGWIKARNDCSKARDPRQCVEDIYTDRIAELAASLPHQFEGTSWRVVRIAGDRVPQAIDVNVTFGADGNLNGVSGCNRYFAPYTIAAQELRIGQIGATRKLCPDPEMDAERRFLDALRQANAWAKQGTDLVLYGTGAELTLRRQ
jgi:heat shock protein HslJ